MKEEVHDCVCVKDKWLEARESKWIYSKERHSQMWFSHTAAPLMPAWHERTKISGLLMARPLLKGEMRPAEVSPWWFCRWCLLESCRLGLPSPAQSEPRDTLTPAPLWRQNTLFSRATPFLMSPHFMFLASLFPFSCCQRGRRCRRSPEGHQTSRGQGCWARGEIRWNISHVLLAFLQGLSIISLCAVGAVLVWHLKGMLWEDFTTSCHFTVQNRCELITRGNLCLHEPLPLPSLRTQQLSHSRQINHEDCVIG